MWDKITKNTELIYSILREAARHYGYDRVSRMASAVAYRTMFALAPLFLLAVFILGLVLGGNDSARTEILAGVRDLAGPSVAEAVDDFLGSVSTSGNTAGVVAFALLLWTGSSLFLEVQNDINDIFEVSYDHVTGVVQTILKRGLAFLWALGLGLVLIVVWLLNSVWQLLESVVPAGFEEAHRLIGLLTPLVSLVVLPLVIALTFQVFSRVRIRPRAVWWGSFFTSVIFLAAAYGAGLYFRFGTDSAAGAAGSIFVILLLAFVLSAVFLFGAEVTKVHARYLERGEVTPAPPPAPEVVVSQPEPAMPLAAVFGFLTGLFVGWRRRS
ncbi:MAG: YihY/virulence factor BrkB family protein [Acidimicrobiia bacterium]